MSKEYEFVSNTNKYAWTRFYDELASALLPFANNRASLSKNVAEVCREAGLDSPYIDSVTEPFTVFYTFNSRIPDERRRKIAEGYAEKFNISSKAPYSFDGIPTAATMNYLGNHSEHDTDNLWLLFESAINFSSHKTEVSKEKFISAFNNVKNQKSFSIDITMFLSWIRPNDFINLNSSVYQFLSDNGFTPKFFKSKSAGNTPDGDTYIRLMEKCRKRFPEIRSFAELYDFSQQSLSDRKETEGSSENNHCGNEDNGSTRYWLYAPGGGASKWEKFYGSGVMAVGWGEIGDLKRFGSKDEIKEKMKEYYVPSLSHKNDALAAWQFSMEMKPGDIVFVKKGKHSIVGRGVVTSDYRYDSSVSDSYKNIRTVNWTDNGEWEHPGQAVMKTLTDITKETDYVNKLNALFPAPQPENPVPERYTSEDFLNEVFISEEKYRLLV
ncbi:MAG: hypothetical protein PUE13_01685, partial [Clostridiales bacterium]|nr:hypothetical protein [Clostridiales bacterium]